METKTSRSPKFWPGTMAFLLLFLFTLSLYGQHPKEEKPRKTLGVVLSGGGAKGVAHVGVLQALEDNNIAIDYIAGTSIGAMVGGLYAAGYSPGEIFELMSAKDFKNASMGHLDKIYDYYFFHHDPAPVWIGFNYDVRHAFNLPEIIRDNIPSNLVSPGMMDFMFMEKLGPASAAAGNNFDSLMIPFRCIASDITYKEAVVLRKGHLAEAVRASMTFPFYFKPIMIDEKVLFDGGMFNNFPADVMMQDFSPDIIVGSVVATNPEPPCVDNIVSQLENMLMVYSDYDLPQGAQGIILYPPVPNLSVTDFGKNQMIFDIGYHSILKHLDSILRFEPHKKFISEVTDKRNHFRHKYPEANIGKIVLQGGETEEGRFAGNFLLHGNHPKTLNHIRDQYFRLLSIDKFRHIYPRLVFDPATEMYIIELDVTKNYPFRRGFGGNLSSRSINQFYAEFAYERLRKNPITLFNNFFVGNIYNSGKIGFRIDFPGKTPFYLIGETSISRWNYARESMFLLEDQKPSFVIQRELLADVRWVFPWGYKAKMETGIIYSDLKNRFYNSGFFSRADTPDVLEFNPVVVYISSERNTLNRLQYPTEGSFLNLKARYIGGNEKHIPGTTSLHDNSSENILHWFEASVRWENYFFSHPVLRPAIISELFLSNRPLFSNYTASRIMGRQYSPFPMAKTRYLDGFRANNYLAGGFKLAIRLNRTWLLQAESHLFRPFRDIHQGIAHSAYYSRETVQPKFMHHAAIVAHTPMGPLSAGVSYYKGEVDPFSFIINFGYILFNRKTF